MIKFFVIIIIAIIISGGLWAVCFMSGKMDTHKTKEQVQYINAWKCKKWREKMGEIIFGIIGIGIISAAILNIVSTQRMWTKKIAFLLGLYSYFAYSMWGNFIFIIIESGCIFVLIKYYMTHSKISGKITKIKYKEINSEVWCCFFIDKYPNATFWLLQEVIERERLRKEDEVVFWAKKITDDFFKIDSFSRVKQIDIVQAI